MSKTTETAWGKDQLFGQRIDEVFAIGEQFQILAGEVLDEKIPTDIGDAELAKILVRRVGTDGTPTGRAFIVGTLGSAIVTKVKALTPDDVPAIVVLRRVDTKLQKDVLVMTYVGDNDQRAEAALAAKFGIELDPFADLAEEIAAVNEEAAAS